MRMPGFRVGPKSNDLGSVEGDGETDTGEGHVKMEAETRAAWP